MLISGISNIFNKQKTNIANNHSDYSPYRVSVRTSSTCKDTFLKTQPSFEAIRSAGDFRNIVNYKPVHCIYCGRPMLSNKIVARLKTNGVFSGPISNFASEMIKYLDYLHPTEREALKKITIMAFEAPKMRLSEAIKRLYPEANQELLKEQKPIFKELATLGNELPRGYKTKFKKLLKVTQYRLEEKPYIPDEFSGKEFAYKIQRVSDTIKDEYLANRIIKLTEPLTHPLFKNKNPLTDKFISKILTLTETRDVNPKTLTKADLQLMLIKQIDRYAQILNRKDIMNFCDIAEKTILHKPVKIKFSNKAFRYDLKEALEGMPNKELEDKIAAVVKRLPTTRTSVNAFITKHELAASDAIGYDMLRPSIVTIEHMHPRSEKGPNELWNYALACERDNNNRSSDKMNKFIEQFPHKHQTQYFREIMEETIEDNIPKETVIKMIKTFTKESGRPIDLADIQPKRNKK